MSLEHIKKDVDISEAQKVYMSATKDMGPNLHLPNREEMRSLYETMLMIREFEITAWKQAREGESLPIHPYAGHEAVSTAICSLLSKNDKIITNHRPYGHFIAKGGDINAAMAELFGKETGVNKGIGGELYLSEPSIGYITSDMIVGACITIATGVGLSLKMQKSKNIAVCFFGEGAATNGAFHEAMSMAVLYKVPVLFVCENNGYSTNTPAIEYNTNELISQQASGYGMKMNVVDGADVLSVRDAAQKALWYMKRDRMPYFLEAIVPRIGAHKQELIEARTRDRIDFAKMRDPILRYKAVLERGDVMDENGALDIFWSVKNRIDEAVRFAKESKSLNLEDLQQYIY